MHALSVMQGVPFDAKHTFYLNRFTDVERYAEMDENFVAPPKEEYEPKVSIPRCTVCSRSWLHSFRTTQRSISGRGWPIHKDATNTSRTDKTM